MPYGSDPLEPIPQAPPPLGRAPPVNAGIAPARSVLTIELPPEADALYGRVRHAEGTAKGDGFVIYGGEPFKPGHEHPGSAARVPGPQGPTSAAGPGQWQEDTWNGLKPDFHARFGREPDFSSDADQKAMTWINGGKTYPGGEDKLRADIAAGKLDTSKLASQWQGFGGRWAGGYGKDPVIAGGNWKVAPEALSYEQNRPDTSIFWMSPDDYKSLSQKGEEPEERPKSRSLSKSLALDESIEAIPELTVKNGRVTDQDGWRRAQAAQDAGVDLIPVAIRGLGPETPEWLKGVNGVGRRFDFKPVPKVEGKPNLTGMPGLAPNAATLKIMEGIGTGARTALGGAAQLAHNIVPEGLSQAVDSFNNLLADKGVPIARIPAGGLDQMESERLQRLRQERGPHETVPEMIGEGLATIPLAALGPGGDATLLARMGGMVGLGAAGGMMSPVEGDDFWKQKATQGAIGAAAGGVLGAGGEVASRIVAPAIAPAARRLLDAGVRLTPGQLLGGMAKGAEGRLTSVIPTASGAIRRSIEDFNRVAYDKVLARIGKSYEGKSVGYDGINAVEKELSAAYNRLLPQVRFKADNEFVADLTNLRDLASEMPADEARQFAAILKNRVVKRMGPSGTMDGQTFKAAESELSQISRGLHRSEVEGQRQLGTAIDEINGMLRENLERQNPKLADQLRKVNGAWAGFVRIRDAATNRVKSLGVFTPSDLLTASKRAAGKRVFARGDALMQDLGRDAESVLPSNVPDSGTAGRLLMGELALGGAATFLHHPEALATIAAGTLAYTSPGVALMRGAAGAGMPGARNFLSRTIRSGSSFLAPGAGMAYSMPAQPISHP